MSPNDEDLHLPKHPLFAMPNITSVVQQQQLQQPPPLQQQLPYMQQQPQQLQQQPQQHQAYPPLPVGTQPPQPPQSMYSTAPSEYNPGGQQRWG